MEKFETHLPNLELQEFFYLRCLANKVKPKILQTKWKRNYFEQTIIKKAECTVIHNGMKCTNIKINYLQTEIANTKTSLQEKLDEPTITNLQNIIFNNKEKAFLQYKNAQIKKLKLLPCPALVRAAINLANRFPNSVVPSTGLVVMADLAFTLSWATSFSLSTLQAANMSWK